MKNASLRYSEIDLLRTLAIGMMVLYHLAFDLEYYYGIPLLTKAGTGGWVFARSTAILFLLLAGASMGISHSKGSARRWKRIAIIALCALGISVATYIWEPELYVRFGILHCIAGSLALLMVLPPSRIIRGVLAISIIIVGNIGTTFSVQTELFVPLGLRPETFTTLDYFPLFPWSGVVIIGALLVSPLLQKMHTYTPAKRTPVSLLALPGRHALFLYIVHQPVLLITLSIVPL
jgi:uncharacterized membrane protein